MRARYPFAVCMIMLLVVVTVSAAGDLRLVGAAKNRDMTTVRSLLKQHIDVNEPDVDGMTPLHWAAHWDDLEAVKLLLAAGASAKAANRYGVTPLHEACLVANVRMIEALLNAGANPNAAYGSGETPLMTASRTGKVEAVNVLVAHGADVNAAEEFRGQTPIMFAASENHPDVVKFLIDHGAKVDARSRKFNFGNPKVSGGGVLMDRAEGGLTPLFFAAREGAIEAGRVLLDAGADLNITETQYGFSPLMTAVYNAHYDFAAMLIDKGADVNDGSLYVAVEVRNLGHYKNRPNPPDRDKTLNSADMIKLLLDRGANPNQTYAKKIPPREAQGEIKVTAGATPLFRATKSADLVTIRMLMEKGANPSLATTDHSTPLMVAAGLGAPLATDEDTNADSSKGDPIDAMKLFVKGGADVNAQNDLGFTAMHYAAQGGRSKLVEFLASNGAKLDLKNKAGKTPLDLAMAPGPQGRYMEINGTSQTGTAALIKKLMAQQ